MQKSRKLMVSLCGLALSSLFVINNQKLVHADSLDSGLAAMSFDNDSAANDSVIKADNSVQNKSAASDENTNNARNLQSSNLNRKQGNNNSAQMHYNADSGMQRSDGQDNGTKVSRVDATMQNNPVTITNPANNTVHVHYVKTDGTSADVGDYDIKLNNQGSQSYNVPKGYNLFNPNGKYNVGSTRYTGTVASGSGGSITNPSGNYVYVNYVDENGNTVDSDSINIAGKTGGTYNIPAGYVSNGDNRYSVSSTSEQVPTRITMYDVDNEPTQNINLSQSDMEKLWDFVGHRTTFKVQMVDANQDNRLIFVNNKQLPSYESWGRNAENAFNKYCKYGLQRQMIGLEWVDGGGSKARFRVSNKTTYKFHDDSHTVDGDTVTVRVHKDSMNRFTDNSGNVQSVNGNTVNVVLTKPQNVDPATNTRLHAQAVRTIKVDFPNNVIPPSYKNIVDSNGVLTQTVKFTRSAMEDGLTGDLIENTIGPWWSNNQDPNFLGFPERTLPRIPGYTLNIKPA